VTDGPATSPSTDAAVFAAFPEVRIDHDNLAFYRGLLERRYLVQRCGRCGWWQAPPRPRCRRCWSSGPVPTEIGGTGTIFLLTVLRRAGVVPLAAVELDEQPGLRVPGTIVGADPDDLRVGQAVSLRWIETGDAPVPAFEPARGARR